MSDSIQTLVVGAADVGGPDPVVAGALALADRLGAALHVVHAYTPPDSTLSADPTAAMMGVGVLTPTLAGPELSEFDDALRTRLRDQLPAASGATTQIHIETGPAPAALARVADAVRADLVVVGASHHHGLMSALVGSTTAGVLRAVHVPLLVLRRPGDAPGTRVLLTTDLSELSAYACGRGVTLARAMAGPDATVRCLHAAGLAPADLPPTDGPAGARRTTELQRFVDRLPPAAGPVEVVVRVGVPAEEIVAEAEAWRADLVVLGTHGRTGVSRLLLGSVAAHVVRDLGCNALVVPPARDAHQAAGDEHGG